MRFRGMRSWKTTPGADLNLIFRLHEVTSLKCARTELHRHHDEGSPAISICLYGRIGQCGFYRRGSADLGKYLLNGGFLMADDFWGDDQWPISASRWHMFFPPRTVELALTNRSSHGL